MLAGRLSGRPGDEEGGLHSFSTVSAVPITPLTDAKQLELARTLYDGGQTDIDTICATLGISRATLYRYLKASGT